MVQESDRQGTDQSSGRASELLVSEHAMTGAENGCGPAPRKPGVPHVLRRHDVASPQLPIPTGEAGGHWSPTDELRSTLALDMIFPVVTWNHAVRHVRAPRTCPAMSSSVV